MGAASSQPQPQPQLPPWRRRWALLRGPQLFLYASPQDQKAECLLYVPGFVASLALDCKSKNCAFKLTNSENTFYFASESQADTSRWLTKLQQAAKVFPSYSGPCFWASDNDEDSVLDVFKPATTRAHFPSPKATAPVITPSDRPRQPSPKPMPRTIFLRSTLTPPQLADRSATLSPRRTTGEPPTTSSTPTASLPRSRESPVSSLLTAPSSSSLELSSECVDSPTCNPAAKQRLSGAWDRFTDALNVQPAKRDLTSPKSKPPSGLYVNVSFKHSSNAEQPSTQASTSRRKSGESISTANNASTPGRVNKSPSSPALSRAVQRRPSSSSSKVSRSRTVDNFPEVTPREETLLDREYNRVFKKSPSASSSPDPATLSDSPATSPVPLLPVLSNSLVPRCATSQEIKDLYTNRRNSWRGSQQELLIPLSSVGGELGSPLEGCTAQSPEYSFRDYSVLDYPPPPQRPDVIPSQYHHQGRPKVVPEERVGSDPWLPRGGGNTTTPLSQERTQYGGAEKASSVPFLRAGSAGGVAPASTCCQASSPLPPPTPSKSTSRFFHSPKFLKKFASSTREGLSNILRSPRLERKKLAAERDMYGSPKLSRSAGVRLLKSSASASAVSSAPAEAPEETLSPSPLTHKSGSSSSLNSSTSAGSFVTSSSSSHCYAEVFAPHPAMTPTGMAPLARPETPETPRARPTMGVSMLRGKRRTSSSAAGSEERSFSPCSLASSAGGSGGGPPYARDDGSVFGEEETASPGSVFQFGHVAMDGSPESALGSGSERD